MSTRRERLNDMVAAAILIATPLLLGGLNGAPHLPRLTSSMLVSSYIDPKTVGDALALIAWIVWGIGVVAELRRYCRRMMQDRRLGPQRRHGPVLVRSTPRRPSPDASAPLYTIAREDWPDTLLRELNAGLDPSGEHRSEPDHVALDSTNAPTESGSLLAHAPAEDVPAVRCLGPLTVQRGQRVIRRGWSSAARELLAYLCAHRDGDSRDRIIDRLWPNDDFERAAKEFRREASIIRARVRTNAGDRGGYLVHVDDSYQLDAATVWVDAWAFLDRIQAARHAPADRKLALLAEAVELYQGEFCADCYYPWLEATRERFRRLFIRACIDLATGLGATGHSLEAIAVLDKAQSVEPTDEALCVLAMELEDAVGRRVDALRRFDRLAQTLGNDIGVAPSPQTIEFANRLRASASSPHRFSRQSIKASVS